MKMPDRHVQISFLIDTNKINARQKSPHMNQLETWKQNKTIEILTSEVAQNEMMQGHSATRSKKAMGFVYTMSMMTTKPDQSRHKQIENIISPAGPSNKNDKNDVKIVFDADKYNRILITDDNDILQKKAELKKIGITVVTDAEAVDMVRRSIMERDDRASHYHEKYNMTLPNWIGCD